MSGAHSHIVHKQILEFDLKNKVDVAEIQDKASKLCNEKMPELLNRIFDRLDLGDESLFIYSMKIDLSALPFQNWESEFLSRCEKQLEKELQDKKNKLHENPSIASEKTEQDRLIGSGQMLFDNFFEFLETGYITNLSKSFSFSNFEHEIINNIEESQAERENFKRQWCHNYKFNPQIISRLARQFSEEFIRQFVKNIWDIDEQSWQILFSQFQELEKTMLNAIDSSSNIYKFLFYESLIDTLSQNSGKSSFEELSTIYIQFWKEKLTTNSEEIHNNKLYEETNLDHPLNVENQVESDNFLGLNPNMESEKKEESNNQKKESKKSGPKAQNTGCYINNAGLVIAASYFPKLFQELNYLSGNEFANPESQEKAIHLTQYLVNGQEQTPEAFLPLNKILCGWPVEKTIAREIALTQKEKEEAGELLQAIIKNWKKLGNSSIEALRETFLQRNATLKFRKEFNDWHLNVEYKEGIDILIEYLPWTISMLKLPWMQEAVTVEWI